MAYFISTDEVLAWCGGTKKTYFWIPFNRTAADRCDVVSVRSDLTYFVVQLPEGGTVEVQLLVDGRQHAGAGLLRFGRIVGHSQPGKEDTTSGV